MDLSSILIIVTLIVQTISVLGAAWKGLKYFVHAQATLEKVSGVVDSLQIEFSDLLAKVNDLTDLEKRIVNMEEQIVKINDHLLSRKRG